MKRFRSLTATTRLAGLVCAALGLTLSLEATAAQALHDRMLYAEMESVAFQSGGVSLDQAISIVQSKYGARVMRANTVEEDGKRVHYIRLMTPDRSRVWTVRVDAATGREF